MSDKYHITVKEEGLGYALYNHGAICGDRLFKGEDKKDPAQQWPFKGESEWVHHENKPDAEKSAKRLQGYLNAREKGMK